MMLFVALANQLPDIAWKSRLHDDGSSYDGWFLVGMDLPGQGMITYHLSDKHWDMLRIKEFHKAPKWDGHNSHEALRRLTAWVEGDKTQ
ncbi:MAG: hypothetical protein F6K62_17570 [Sphaerospermopsis sp. SIO1G2]|nr:hypothetical protein [Sphaerospermopsis sp. SIO1G2]